MLTFCRALAPATAWAQAAPANPYNQRLAEVEAQIGHATPPQAAVLLARGYGLREYVDDAAEVGRWLERIANDSRQQPLVRDEALRYLALSDLHRNRLPEAESRLKALGFVRAWSIAGPFTTASENAHYGPEHGFRPGESFTDPVGRTRVWRSLPPLGPQLCADLARLYPHTGAAVAFAYAAVYSEQPQAVALRFSADSTLVLSVNGRAVFTDKVGQAGLSFDQHAVAAELHAGWNSVLLKLDYAGEGPWRFALRITAMDGGGIALPASAEKVVDPATDAVPHPPEAPTDLVEMARAAADASPGSSSALETLGLIEHEHARGNALEHLEAAATRAPSAERWLRVADACGDSACVFNAANAALRSGPSNEPARVVLANYYFARNQLEKARDLLREAARLEPDDPVARNGLADLDVAVGLNAEALMESARLEQEFPKVLWLERKLAARYLDFGLLARAQALLREALSRNYDGEQERALLLRIYERQPDTAALRSAYEELNRLDPGDPAPLAELAALDAGAGDFAAAQRHMRTALAVAPDDDGLHQRFAELLTRSGRPHEAREELARALEINPHREEARRYLDTLDAGRQPDPEAQYLEDPAALAAAAHRQPPAIGDNAVALADIRVERVFDNGLSTVRQQQIYYLATERGAEEFANRSVQYAPGTQQLRILQARIYKADGRVLDADEAGETSVADRGAAMYYDVRSHLLRFPGLEAGDVIELDYRISPAANVNAYGDYFGGLVVFRSRLAERLRRYVLITPAPRRFHILEQRVAPAVVSASGGQRIYRWEARNQQALPNETRGPAVTDSAPYVHVSTFQSWDEVGRWYAQLIAPQFALDATLHEVAARLLKNARTEQERISAIHQFVLRNTHYVALEFGIYSYKPYPVSQVYARRFGDCKDKASLMIALLRQAGIEADLALVRTRRLGEIDPQATSIALFDHAIVYLPKYDLWLDGTAEYAGSRELPLEDQGATALVVGADGHAALRHIPVTAPADNYTRRTVHARVLADGRIDFNGTFYTRGEDAPGLRRDYQTPERQRDALRNALAEVFPSVRVDEVHVDGANDLEHPVTVDFHGTLDTFAGRSSVPLASSWMQRSYVQNVASLATRTQDLLLPAPWTTEEELHFRLPQGAAVALPPNTALETQFGSASLRYERTGRELVVRTSVQFRKLRVTPVEYAAFRDFCRQVERAFHNEVKLSLQ